MQNLAYYRTEAGAPVAVLIDFDLATVPPYRSADREERIGTAPFMARDHLISLKATYGLQHDFESFFYCAVWHGLGYETSETYPCKEGCAEDILMDWRTGSYVEMGYSKNFFLMSSIGIKIMDEMAEQNYARKCRRLFLAFRQSLLQFAHEMGMDEDALAPMKADPSIPNDNLLFTRMTYEVMLKALEVDVLPEPCEDVCCLQFRRKDRCIVK